MKKLAKARMAKRANDFVDVTFMFFRLLAHTWTHKFDLISVLFGIFWLEDIEDIGRPISPKKGNCALDDHWIQRSVPHFAASSSGIDVSIFPAANFN